jgi:prepilin-type N-terminal cleavage/methylation domain-containing protein
LKQFHQAGFTLLEILIASVILFTMLSLGAVGFKNARMNSEHAADTVFLLAPLPLVLDTIQLQIREKADAVLQGEGSLQGVSYSWIAEEISFLPPQPKYIVETSTFVEYPQRFRLYQVTLTLTYRTKSRTFNYREVAWRSALSNQP